MEIKLGWRGQALPQLNEPQFNEQSHHALRRLGGKITAQTKQNPKLDDDTSLHIDSADDQILTFTLPLKAAERAIPPQSRTYMGEKFQPHARKG